MGKTSKSSFKKVAAGVLAVITLASYSFPANTGILSNRPTLSANATGTENSIHVYGSLRNATGNNLTVVYRPQNSLSTSSVKTFEDGELWNFDGDITMIYSPVKLVFPTQWNTDFQKTEETPHVDDITNEEYDDEKDQYVYTFNSPKGNTYQYENLTYAKREVVFAKRGDFIDNGNGTHTNPFDNTIEEHDTTKFEVSAETKGDYGFEEISPGLWRSNNYGKYYTSTSNAKTTFKVKVEDGHAINLNYWVSNEENIDYLKLTIDNVNVFKQKNGIVEGATNRSSGCFTLSPGKTHTIVAEYCHFKDPTEEAITATSRYLDAAMIQFSSPCSKCDNTPVRAYMQFDRLWKGDLGVENGEHIKPTLTWGNTGKKYWLNRKSSVYSNESLYFDCPDNNFTVTEHIGNFKYESVNYRHRYDIEIPNPELGVFIDVSQGYYDDTNYLFSCKAKKGVSTDLSKLTVNDFVITMDPSLDEEEAARLKAVIESDKTIKWIKTFTNGSVYYVIYNPELAEYDEWDDTAFISYCVYDVTKYEITDSDLVSPVDLITLDKNGKANPNSFVTVVAENADGTSSALVANKDYKFVSAASTSESGEFTVELNGIGDCTGYASKTMTVVSADELTKVEAKAPGKDGYGNIEYYTVNDKYYLPVEGYTNGYKEVSEKDVIIEGTASVISDDFIVPAVDLIVLDKNGKASPNNYVSVVDGNATELTEGTDYEFVSAASTNESGEFTVEISGIGDYTGTASKAMNIVAASDLTKVEAKAANIGVVGNIEYFTVDGKCFLPVDGYENGYKEVSEADVIIEPIILDLSDDFIVPVVDLIVLDNDGKASPNNYVSVIGKDLNGKDSKLTEGTDYEFISTASTNESGEFIVEISGIGGYTGTASKAMNVIAASDLTKVEAKAAELGVNGNIEYFTVDGKCFLPVDGYENGYKEVPEASVIIKALTFELSDDSIVPAVDLIVLDNNGKASPNNYVSVVDGNATELTEGADYEFISAASTSESGEFEVEISGIGAYTGTASKAMNVIAASDLTKVEAKAAEKGINGNIEYFTVDGKCFLPVDGYENGYKEVSEADVIIEAEPFTVPSFKTQNLVLSGQIGVNFFLDLSGLTDEEKAASYVEFTVNGKTTKDTFDESFKNQTGEYYGFTCYVTSVQMADTITAVFHYGDETVERTYSVLEYIKAVEKISDKLEPEMVALVQSISDYGHYVQPMLAETNKWTIGVDHEEMTKYYAESYNFEDIKEVVKKYAHKSNLVKTDIDKITYSLSLNAETALNVFVSPNANYSGNISISVDGLSENDYTVTKQASDGRYKIVITNISAHKLGNTYKINITTDNGTSTYQASALSFINAVLNANYDTNTKNAASSIYKYYEATMTYRNK
ncbi:hypothetical protein [Ruminococcus sp.]|uniref:hypothetical protein n=1 Tax=Ruminococcus sp. TaxID=41978 RepID=UPI0025E760CF|nr:hypothetical protein [Ruminococcus sp.]